MTDSAAKLREAIEFHQRGDFLRADALYGQLATELPAEVVVFYNWGVLASQQAEPPVAIQRFRRAVEVNPQHIESWFALGQIYVSIADFDSAIAAYSSANQVDSNHKEIWNQLGNAHRARRDLVSAEQSYRRALAIDANYAESLVNLGLTLHEQGFMEAAVVAYRSALAIQPRLAPLHFNFGNALVELGDHRGAVERYRAAIQLEPSLAQAYFCLANSLRKLGEFEQVQDLYREGLLLSPQAFEGHFNLANFLQELGDFEQAIEHYRCAHAIQPGRGLVALTYQLQMACDWHDIEQLSCEVIAKVLSPEFRSEDEIDPYLFICLTTPTTPAQQLRCAQVLSNRVVRTVGKPLPPPSPRNSRLGKRLRVGYLCADIRNHPTAWLVADLFESHDRQHFHISCYSYGPDDRSPIRQRVVNAFDLFRDVTALSHRQIAEQIASDEIDILIDLSGYANQSRTEVMALRPAPIQAQFLGYCGTMGADFIDYIIADDFVIPGRFRDCYSEKIVYLPRCYQPGDRKLQPGPIDNRADWGLPEAAFVFASFDSCQKISPAMFGIWMRLLREVDNSVLWLLEGTAFTSRNLQREAEKAGVDPNRLFFACWVDHEKHLARHRHIDLFLDTFPYGAHTTASDALRMEIPLLTLCGDSFSSRVAGSMLSRLDLHELITHDFEAYCATALKLAKQPNELDRLTQKLKASLTSTDLFDGDRFARDLERAFNEMWRLHEEGKPPQHLEHF